MFYLYDVLSLEAVVTWTFLNLAYLAILGTGASMVSFIYYVKNDRIVSGKRLIEAFSILGISASYFAALGYLVLTLDTVGFIAFLTTAAISSFILYISR